MEEKLIKAKPVRMHSHNNNKAEVTSDTVEIPRHAALVNTNFSKNISFLHFWC